MLRLRERVVVFSIRCKGKLPILLIWGRICCCLRSRGRALYDVSALGLRGSNGIKLRMANISPRREVIRKFLRGMFLVRFLIAWG